MQFARPTRRPCMGRACVGRDVEAYRCAIFRIQPRSYIRTPSQQLCGRADTAVQVWWQEPVRSPIRSPGAIQADKQVDSESRRASCRSREAGRFLLPPARRAQRGEGGGARLPHALPAPATRHSAWAAYTVDGRVVCVRACEREDVRAGTWVWWCERCVG